MKEIKAGDYVSVSTIAKITGKTKQAIYNRIRCGKYETKTFDRGSMVGLLVKVPENIK